VMVIHVIVSSRYLTRRKPVTNTIIALMADICSTFIDAKIQNNLYSNVLLPDFLLFLQ